jgi:acetylornithine deacetylase/succinyl-diaminopimelate desuccinylase-like protein
MKSCLLVLISLLIAQPFWAQGNIVGLQDETVEWLEDYISVNTVNPPGNEIAGARFLAGIFDAEGIDYEIAESAPGRGNIWARLEGGNAPALILLHHMDVVPAEREYWLTDPLSAEIRDGYIYGRGTLDTKSSGILHLAAFIELHRRGSPLSRDLIFMATADEEAGGYFGVGWLVENRPELFENVGYVINEGGGGREDEGRAQFGVEVTQKVPYWLRLTAQGEPGHGSRPLESSAVTDLIAALERLREYEFEPRIVPAVDAYFRGLAPTAAADWQDYFSDIATAIRVPGVASQLQRDNPGMHALIRNTCSITRFGGSDKINVVPPEAWAELDCRLLPDQAPEAFLSELGDVLGDDIAVETILGFTPAVSPVDTDLYRVLESVSTAYFPGAPVVPAVGAGFTDSHFLRDLGITAYGYTPTVIPLADRVTVHGNNERISVENVRRGVAMMLDILESLDPNPRN